MSFTTAPRTRDDFRVAVICALPLEAESVQAVFDQCWDDEGQRYGKTVGDQNAYTTGKIGKCNVVLVHMPDMGSVSASQVAANLRSSYPRIELALVVGICGVAPIHPQTREEIVLGDVVVSTAVTQYDFGQQYPDHFRRKKQIDDSLERASPALRALMNKLKTNQCRQRMTTNLARLMQTDDFEKNVLASKYPGPSQDRLYEASYVHQHQSPVACPACSDGSETCPKDCRDLGCDERQRIVQNRHCRPRTSELAKLPDDLPIIHLGRFGSANTVMKSGSHRDALVMADGLAAFEMEGAGVWEQHPTIVIKAACDYADSHKNKSWQPYAAAVAAGCLKVFLEEWVTEDERGDIDEPRALGLCLSPNLPVQLGDFIGRTAEIEEIHNLLWPKEVGTEQRQVVLGGMGGIGKTQLAIAYAQLHKNTYTTVLWLNATSPSTLLKSFRSIAERLLTSCQLENLNDGQVPGQVREWLSHTADTRWLLIFDNYDDPDLYKLDTFRPDTSHGSIIITTRLPNLLNGPEIRLSPLQDLGESLDILQRRSKREGVRDDIGARRLAARLEGLPLALVTAGAYLSRNTITFQQYLDAYELRWQVDRRRPLRLPEYSSTLYTTWSLTYSRLEIDDKEAAQMLKLLAYFDNQEIWYELLQAGLTGESSTWLPVSLTDRIDFEDVMGTLVEYCLVDVQHESRSYSIHNCVHDWTLGALNVNVNSQWYWYAFDCVAATFDLDVIEGHVLRQLCYARMSRHAVRLTHHRLAVCDQTGSELTKRYKEAHWIARMLQAQDQLCAAEQMFTRALAGCERVLGPDHTWTLNIIDKLGSFYCDQGDPAKAEQMYLRALSGYETAFGKNHTSTLTTVNNLGELYTQQGKLAEAEQLYMRALAGCETALGPDHMWTLSTVNNLGNLYRDQGKLVEAEDMYERALAGKCRALGPDHTSTLRTLENLGNLYGDQGKLVDAERIHLHVLAGYESALGPEHSWTLRTVNNLGILYGDQGRQTAAEQMYTRAVAGYEKTLGSEHMTTLQAVMNLGSFYGGQGKLAEAERLFRRTLAGCGKVLGPEHPLTRAVVGNLEFVDMVNNVLSRPK